MEKDAADQALSVSTHSRPKAAGHFEGCDGSFQACFNTQPPEGGWDNRRNTVVFVGVSTHSRPKAAGRLIPVFCSNGISFNTQPPEGGWKFTGIKSEKTVEFQHTAARRRLATILSGGCDNEVFQHTAARRRLGHDGKTAREI